MKQFSLDEFKKNPSRKIVTRDWRTVRIICTDFQSDKPIIGLVKDKEENKERAYNFSEDGRQYPTEDVVESNLDLFFVPIKKEGWVNIYQDNKFKWNSIFDTKEEAEEIGKSLDNYITTIKIEWEQP
jgi:hypothetical protein